MKLHNRCSKLCEFYDPRVLENLESLDTLVEDASLSPVMESSSIPWFEEPSRVLCASLALQTLSEAVGKSNRKFKNKVAFSPNLLINTAFWLARRGPVEILVPCLNLLEQMVAENPEVRDEVVKVSLRVSVPKRGKHVPHSFEQSVRISGTSHLTFGWWPLKEDQKFILIPALLAERYIFSDAIWAVENIPSNRPQYTDVVAQGCLRVLDSILSVDPTYSGLLLQFILAAPPPELDEDVLAAIGSPGKALETMKPIGVLILNTLLEASNRCILANKYSRASSIEVGDGAVSTDLEIGADNQYISESNLNSFLRTITNPFYPRSSTLWGHPIVNLVSRRRSRPRALRCYLHQPHNTRSGPPTKIFSRATSFIFAVRV